MIADGFHDAEVVAVDGDVGDVSARGWAHHLQGSPQRQTDGVQLTETDGGDIGIEKVLINPLPVAFDELVAVEDDGGGVVALRTVSVLNAVGVRLAPE